MLGIASNTKKWSKEKVDMSLLRDLYSIGYNKMATYKLSQDLEAIETITSAYPNLSIYHWTSLNLQNSEDDLAASVW